MRRRVKEVATTLLVWCVGGKVGNVVDDNSRVWTTPLLLDDDVQHLEGGEIRGNLWPGHGRDTRLALLPFDCDGDVDGDAPLLRLVKFAEFLDSVLDGFLYGMLKSVASNPIMKPTSYVEAILT